MSEEHFIIKRWDDEIIVFKDNLLAIRHKPSRKAVHDIRVAVKKLRAYLRLRQEVSGEKWEEEFSPVKMLFQTCGRLRDFEMSLSSLYSYQRREKCTITHFKKYLQTNGRLARRWARQTALDFNEEQLQEL